MRVIKVKKEKKAPKKSLFDSKKMMIGLSAGAAVFIILIAVIMLIETKDDTRLIIKNDTDMKLEYVSTIYKSGETDLSLPFQTESINANKTLNVKSNPLEYNGYNANNHIKFKFKGHSALSVDAGLFNTRFSGDIKIVFSKTKDPNKLKMTVKANRGLIPSSLISCDENYTVDFKRKIVFD